MAFVEQDDTGLIANANAYISLVEMRAYWLDRGTDLAAVADADLEAAIILATAYMDFRYPFLGYMLNDPTLQFTQWPRQEVYYAYPNAATQVTGLPRQIKEVCAELAQIARTEALFQPSTTVGQPGGLRRTVDVVGPLREEREYFGTGSTVTRKFPKADSMLVAARLVTVNTSQMVRA